VDLPTACANQPLNRATDGRWGLGYGLGLLPGGDLLAYHEGANRGWRAGLALLPDRRAGIVVLANGDGGGVAIDAVVQRWVALATPRGRPSRATITEQRATR
jgi:CubicO group peptidase (beta-lactamase class C family)